MVQINYTHVTRLPKKVSLKAMHQTKKHISIILNCVFLCRTMNSFAYCFYIANAAAAVADIVKASYGVFNSHDIWSAAAQKLKNLKWISPSTEK